MIGGGTAFPSQLVLSFAVGRSTFFRSRNSRPDDQGAFFENRNEGPGGEGDSAISQARDSCLRQTSVI